MCMYDVIIIKIIKIIRESPQVVSYDVHLFDINHQQSTIDKSVDPSEQKLH